jgi:antitoxin component of MazEF toxin-antitoxin module
MRSIARLFRQGRSTALVVPRPILYQLSWQNGVEVELQVIDGKLLLCEVERAILERAQAKGITAPPPPPPVKP